MELTKNFQLSEFACHDGTEVPDELIPNVHELAKNLQVLRDEVGESIEILSGYRTESWNTKIGGAKLSQHKEAKASDVICRTKTSKELHKIILRLIKENKMRNGGLGLYKSFVHYDIGPVRRWNG